MQKQMFKCQNVCFADFVTPKYDVLKPSRRTFSFCHVVFAISLTLSTSVNPATLRYLCQGDRVWQCGINPLPTAVDPYHPLFPSVIRCHSMSPVVTPCHPYHLCHPSNPVTQRGRTSFPNNVPYAGRTKNTSLSPKWPREGGENGASGRIRAHRPLRCILRSIITIDNHRLK